MNYTRTVDDGLFIEIQTILGEESTLKLFQAFEGQSVYFPKRVLGGRVHKAIFNEFNGVNYLELAQKYHFSIQYIREIVDKQRRLRS